MKTGGISKYYAKGRLKAGALNQSEANYEAYLRALCQTGDILWFKFTCWKKVPTSIKCNCNFIISEGTS